MFFLAKFVTKVKEAITNMCTPIYQTNPNYLQICHKRLKYLTQSKKLMETSAAASVITSVLLMLLQFNYPAFKNP